MYNSKLAVAIKHNGKILRETKDLVKLPYGSEFSVLVKNLNSKRVKFTLHIDGTDVLSGEQIIVRPNSDVEVKRFIRNGNMDEGNAFKFIERTKSIEDGPRGIKVDDGIVRVEFWFEQDQPEIKVNDIYWNKHHYRDYYTQPYWSTNYGSGMSTQIVGQYNSAGPYTASTVCGASGSAGTFGDSQYMNTSCASALRGTINQVSASNATFSNTTATSASVDSHPGSLCADNEIGITVPGSKVEQKFTPVYGFKSEVNSHVIVLRLVGIVGEVEVVAPITVEFKPQCVTCGRRNKANSKYCTDCGTALAIV